MPRPGPGETRCGARPRSPDGPRGRSQSDVVRRLGRRSADRGTRARRMPYASGGPSCCGLERLGLVRRGDALSPPPGRRTALVRGPCRPESRPAEAARGAPRHRPRPGRGHRPGAGEPALRLRGRPGKGERDRPRHRGRPGRLGRGPPRPDHEGSCRSQKGHPIASKSKQKRLQRAGQTSPGRSPRRIARCTTAPRWAGEFAGWQASEADSP